MSFAIEDLYETMGEVFNVRKFPFAPHMSSKDIPGWTSLNHTILLMEIESRTGVDLTAAETANLRDISALYEAILKKM